MFRLLKGLTLMVFTASSASVSSRVSQRTQLYAAQMRQHRFFKTL